MSDAKIKQWAVETMSILSRSFLQDLQSQWTANREAIVGAIAKNPVVCDNGHQQVTFFSADYIVELLRLYESTCPTTSTLNFKPLESIEAKLRKCVEGSFEEFAQVALFEFEFFSQDEIESNYKIESRRGIGCFIDVYVIPAVGKRPQTNCSRFYADEICALGNAVCLVEVCDDNVKVCTLDLKYQIPEFLIKSFKPVRFDNFEWHEGCAKFVGMNDPDSNDVDTGDLR